MIKMQDNTKNLKTDYVGFMLVNNLFLFLTFLLVLSACTPTAQPIVKDRYYITLRMDFLLRFLKVG